MGSAPPACRRPWADAGDGIRDFDNGVFATLYALGWFGGAGLLLAAVAAVTLILRRREPATDTMAKAARAAAVTSLVLALGANIFEGVSAAVLWGFVGLVIGFPSLARPPAPGTVMNLTVLLPTYRRVADLERCLDALGRQHRRPDQVVVVSRRDDADTLAFLGTVGSGPLPLEVVHPTAGARWRRSTPA